MYLLWLRVAAILYAAASVAIFPAVLHGLTRWRRSCIHLAGLAFFFHFVSCVEMLVQAHRWMPVGVREVESLLGFAVAGVFFLVWAFYDAISLGIFALPITFFVIFVPSLGPDRYTFPSAGVRVGWLVAHIVALLAAYVALCFSLLASVLYLAQESRLKSKRRPGERLFGLPLGWLPAQGWLPSLGWFPSLGWLSSLDWLPPLDTLERIAHATLEFGFPCMTIGLVIGSVLAQETALGAAYFRDPKVIASFVLWVVYVILLFVRRRAGLRGRRAAYLVGAVFLVMLAVLAANVFSQVHRYGPR
jgi:ABC-type uncharacterized transport system permease subunit